MATVELDREPWERMEELEKLKKAVVRRVSNDHALLLIFELLMNDAIGMEWMETYGCRGRSMIG